MKKFFAIKLSGFCNYSNYSIVFRYSHWEIFQKAMENTRRDEEEKEDEDEGKQKYIEQASKQATNN